MYCSSCSYKNNNQARFCANCGTLLQSMIENPAIYKDLTPINTVQYAGFWRRAGAAVVDIATVIAGSFILWIFYWLIVAILTDINPFSSSGPKWLEYLGLTVIFISNLVYFSAMERSSQQATLGKIAVGIIVTDCEGNRLSFWRAALRFIVKVISAASFGILIIVSCFTIVFTQKKQALHDITARCHVIMKA